MQPGFDIRPQARDSRRIGARGGMPDMAAKHVLLIEDEANIAEAISFILGRAGWRVTHLADGLSAMQALRAAAPHVMVLDFMLPGRSGLEILTDLRADPAFAALPVLMLTARGQVRDREAAERAGATAFISKPFSNAELLACVRGLAGEDA